MKQLLIIPDRTNINESIEISGKYNAGFEYNDFFMPEVLDDVGMTEDIISEYRKIPLPAYNTLHGAFFDVIVFSVDEKIREISDLRVKQSIAAARKINARAAVFHTNYNPFLNSEGYIKIWTEQNEKYWSGILRENPDIDIYIENMFDTSPDVLAGLSEKLGGFPNYGVCFDYAHAALGNVPHREWAEKLGKYVKHIHINDNDLISDLHLAVGDGKIVWDEFYELYAEYMDGSSILIETASSENQKRSFEKLISDGFIGTQF